MLTEVTSSFFATPEEASEVNVTHLEQMHSSEHGFCDLYRVNKLGRFRVLKCLKPEFRGNSVYEGLLRKDFEIGYALDHPNICQYYSLFRHDNLGNCIEMEWIDGRTLEELIIESRPSKDLQDKILDQLCDALSYMHSKQVLHRDVKPSNIIVTYKGDIVKLIDFGLSDSTSHSVLKIPAGTAIYTAPEVLKGSPADVRSEVYSLGLVIASLGNRHRNVVRKCCEKRPQNRYATVSDVKKALHSRLPYVSGVLFIVLVAIFALFPYVSGLFSKTTLPDDQDRPDNLSTAVEATDTLVVTIDSSGQPGSTSKSQPPVKTKPKVQSPSEKEETFDEAVIDELFRQATDMFE